jgi:hypothetical protein
MRFTTYINSGSIKHLDVTLLGDLNQLKLSRDFVLLIAEEANSECKIHMGHFISHIAEDMMKIERKISARNWLRGNSTRRVWFLLSDGLAPAPFFSASGHNITGVRTPE